MGLIHMSFLSKLLGMPTDINVVIPTYTREDSTEGTIRDPYVPGMKFQTLWLLHGGGGDYADYLKYTNIELYAEENKVAVVMPSGYNSAYTDNPEGALYMQYITEELPAMCRSIFPFSPAPEDNIIGGLSMGSGGAFKIAMAYPERYGMALIMSGGGSPITKEAAKLFDSENYVKRLGGFRLPILKNDGQEGTVNDGWYNAKRNVDEGRPLPKLYFALGTEDSFITGHRRCVAYCKELGYEVSSIETEGYRHEWRFWDRTLDEALSRWLPLRRSYLLPQ